MTTITSLLYNPSTLLSFFNSLKSAFASAGFPSIHFEQSNQYPYYLVYEFEPNLYFSFEMMSPSNNRSKYRIYEQWDSVSKTGLGDIYNMTENNFFTSYTNAGITAIADDNRDFGFVTINTGTQNLAVFGFIKLVNPFSNYPVDYPKYFFLNRLNGNQGSPINFNNSETSLFTFTNAKKYGAGDYLDKLSDSDFNKNVVDPSGKYSLTSPLVIRSGGISVGVSSDKLAYCPYLNSPPGTRLIVNQGIEEWIYINGGIAVREI